MNRFDALKRWTWSVFIVFTLALAGCEGDDGAPGADGTDGADGADGANGLACWDLNGNGIEDPEEDINGDGVWDALDCQGADAPPPVSMAVETCGICHSDNSIADAVVAHELPPIEMVSNVEIAVAANTTDLEVTFDLTVDGSPGLGYDALERAYRNDGTTETSFCNAPQGSSTCDPASATLTEVGGGSYLITVVGGATEAAIPNRYLFRVSDGGASETRVYLYGDFPLPSPVETLEVSAAACNACHGPEGIDVHGGYFAASDGGEPCLTCHGAEVSSFGFLNNGPVVSLVEAVHAYHSGIWLDGTEVVDVTFPTYMNNCSVCHAEPAQLTAVNAMPFTPEGCFSCHGSIEGIPFDSDLTAQGHAEFDETTVCTDCHADGSFASEFVVVTDSHNGATTERGGVIWDGEDTSVTEGALFDWRITGVADDGTNLTITWVADYNGAGVDPCNDIPVAGTPAFFAIPPIPDDPATPEDESDDRNNLSILRSYAQGEDFILGPREGLAGQPNRDVDVTADNTTCDGLVATTVIPVEETDATNGRVGMQGKPWVVNIDPDGEDLYMQVRAKSPTYDYVVGVGGPAPARRALVDTTGKCLNCHVGSMYQHGGNRVDNVDLCLICHNTAANDQYVRVGYGVDESEAYDGRLGQNFGMREMLHAVHSAGEAAYDSGNGAPLVIYRGRGIYGWAGDVSQLSNWPAGDWPGDIRDLPIFGSDDGEGNPVLQTHHFHTPTYPRGLYECTACHVDGFEVLPDPTKAMASTVETGDEPFEDQVNDVLEGVTASSCMTCHRSSNAGTESALKRHAYENGWTPQAFPEGRQTIIDANE